MEDTYRDLADRVLQKWAAKRIKAAEGTAAEASQGPGPRLLIALAGPPGSGKTTIATRVVEAVNNWPNDNRPKTIAVSADGFHLPLATLRSLPNATEAIARRGAPWTFDGAAVVDLVRELRDSAGLRRVLAPTFDHAVKDPVADGLQVDADVDVCILEGNYLLCNEPPWHGIGALVDDRWLVHVEADLALERVAARHLAAGIEPTMELALQRARANDATNGEFIMEKSKGRYDLLVESVEEAVGEA